MSTETPPRRTAALLLLLLASACGGPPAAEEPLLDGSHRPDVLVERQQLSWPPELDGNRFVRGWSPWQRRGVWGLVPDARRGAVLELVNLEPRPRTLRIRFAAYAAPDGLRVAVRAGGRELGDFALTDPLDIPLPELPVGRVGLELRFPAAAPVAVAEALLQPAATGGAVRFEPAGVVQEGPSAVDVTRRLTGDARLSGSFRPPPEAAAGLRYGIAVSGPGGERTHPVWPGPGAFDLALGRAGELVRIRLLAEGRGPAGRWEDLRLAVRRRPAPPAAPPPPPRLVVLYLLDALRADSLGHLGGPPEATPTIDRLAREGVTFTDHFSVAPNTMPSTKALFTGRAWRTRGGWKLPAEGPPTLAERWAAAGYRTAAFSANAFVSFAFGLARGFEQAPRAVGRVDRRSGRVADARRVHRFGLRWLDSLEPGERAFLYLHTVHPHNPYDPPEPFRSRFVAGIDSDVDGSSETLADVQQLRRTLSVADRERLRGLYLGGLAYNDDELGELVAELEARYEPGEVLLVVTSDHGEELFDHGGVLHGYTLYDEQLHVPLIFWWPGRLEPRRVSRPTDALDLHATLRRLAGGAEEETGEGEPLWGLLTGSSERWRRPVRFAAASSLEGGIFMARSDGAKLIWAPRTGSNWGMGQGLGRTQDAEYLFDLEADPRETVNLAGSRAGAAGFESDWLRARLRAWIERGEASRLAADEAPEEIDEETRRRLRALGYLD